MRSQGTLRRAMGVSAPHGQVPLCPARGFYSGLDEKRVHRLRRSGMTFNKPRGRDTLSLAFESRVRVLPLHSLADLYAPVEPPSHPLKLKRDPSLPGEAPGKIEGAETSAAASSPSPSSSHTPHPPSSSHEWRVLVVHPIEQGQVEAPVDFPAAHPSLYADWQLHGEGGHRTAAGGAGGRGGLLDYKPLDRLLFGGDDDGQSHRLRLAAGQQSSADGADAQGGHLQRRFMHLAAGNRRHLRQNGDTTLFPSSFSARFRVPGLTAPLPPSEAKAAAASGGEGGKTADSHPQTQQVRFFLSMVVDPYIDLERFRREEAQVEMISGYRNLFYEALDLPAATTTAMTTMADVIRIPALSIYTCGTRFVRDIGKLNQQSIIKGFHRVSSEAKEQLIMNRNFTVELYVPPLLLGHFEDAFAEEAWDIPESILNPGRTALYPGLAPPRTLLDYDGWVGKRPELVEAVETEGRSLMRGPRYALDGSEIREEEVLSHIRVFGTREEEHRMLEGERRTAAEAVGGEDDARTHRPVAALRPGLQEDHSE